MTHIPFGIGVVVDGKSKKRKKPTAENQLQKALIEYLKILPWVLRVNRHNVGQAWMGGNLQQGYRGRPVYFSERGHSDLSVEIKGDPRIIWIETKAPGARPSSAKQKAHWDDQEAFLARKRASGHIGFFCSSGEILRTEIQQAGLPAPSVTQIVEGMRKKKTHPSTIAAFIRRMGPALFDVPPPKGDK